MNQLEPIFLCSRHLSVMPWSFRPFSSFSSSVSRTWRFFFACQPNVARRTIRAVGLRCLDVQTGARSAQVENLASASPARGGARSAQVVLWGGAKWVRVLTLGGKKRRCKTWAFLFCVCVHFWRSMVEKGLVFFVWSPQTKQNAQMSNHWNNWSSPGSVAHRVRSLSPMFEWSSGHDVCFTRRRSRVQSSPRILLFFVAPPFRCCVFLSAWFFLVFFAYSLKPTDRRKRIANPSFDLGTFGL